MASFIQSFENQIDDAQAAPQAALFIKKDELHQLALAAAEVTTESGLPSLTEDQRGRVPNGNNPCPTDLLSKLAGAVEGDAVAVAALGITGPEINKVVIQTLTLHGYVTQAQQTESAATGQAEVIVNRTGALFEQLSGYFQQVAQEPAGARPADEHDAILAVLTAPLSLWQTQRQRESAGRKGSERVAAPLKEQLALSEEAVADLAEINRLLGHSRA